MTFIIVLSFIIVPPNVQNTGLPTNNEMVKTTFNSLKMTILNTLGRSKFEFEQDLPSLYRPA